MGRWPVVLMVAAGAATLIGIPAGSAADLGTLTLDAPSKVVNWSGSNPDATGQGYSAPLDAQCTAAVASQPAPAPCDLFTLHVKLDASDVPGGVKGPKSPTGGGINKLQAYPNLPGDGVLVSISWPTDFDQWNLYVDNAAGNPVGGTTNCATASQAPAASACGSDLDSNSQSVLIPWPIDGGGSPVAHWDAQYAVKVVPFYTDFVPNVDKSYRGQALLFTDPLQRTSGSSQVLPRIQTPAPANFHVADVPPIPSNPTGWRFTSPGTFANSCYLDETIQYGSTKCLRFDNGIRNLGAGPLTLEFQYDANALQTAITNATDIPAGSCHMNQEILSANSATTGVASLRDAGPCIFHLAHMHFHYQNMGRYKLFALGADGNPHAIAWPDPGQASADPVAKSNKIGFCTIDVDNYTFGQPAATQRPRTYSFPTCNVPNGYVSPGQIAASCGPASPGGCQQYVGAPEYMGISPGWGDIYTWDLPTQYIDISKVPDGVYEVTSSSNPDGGMLTTDHLPPGGAGPVASRVAAGDNGTSLPSSLETGVSCIQLKTNADGSTSVKTVQEFPSQPNDAPLPTCDLGKASLAGTPSGPGAVPALQLPNTSATRPGGLAPALATRAAGWLPAVPTVLALVVACALLARPRRRNRRLR